MRDNIMSLVQEKITKKCMIDLVVAQHGITQNLLSLLEL